MVTPRRATFNLIATALIVTVVCAAGLFGGRSPDTATSVVAATERTPSLAQIVRRSLHSLPVTHRRC